ncbi:hypothetical protein [Cylindrospermopsis raciborskii]|uniref:Uncharacterized protein n=2 Tax=Cylindrospermopsis raciborskii TaxID=77022 RepID=A0A853MES1_9CYAN|nr:hypothetical protein [Cylindrospermopsis raciborskii]EFA71152.1 hypothetical protein CRC_00002 [Cylindrospermopsis raciborskii CS-505]OBU75776.1 hypothetical protein A9P98_05175 [Cylindrospermopsis raciborskii CS-505]OHY32028.1 hypothetical protein BCV63_07620 [Cylindrospermopsis raciborskii CS-508]
MPNQNPTGCVNKSYAMAYSEFTTLDKVIKTFSLQVEEDQNLFCEVKPLQPSDYLQQTLQEYLPLTTAINTEKARSEFLIAPVLAELRRQTKHQISLFSGTEFNVDPERGFELFGNFYP